MDKKTPNKPCRGSVEWGYIGRVNIYQSAPDQRGGIQFLNHISQKLYTIFLFL